jgi:hypothetical protein
MTRMNVTLLVTIAALSGALVLATSLRGSPQNQNPPRSTPKPIETLPNGRYQIVNGTPEMARNIMLLDTQTGQTWAVCLVDNKDSWCAMHRYQEGEKPGLSVGKNQQP